jgi:cell division protein FtsW (lipid II flippase)
MPATLDLLEWGCPLFFAFHVLVHYQQYPMYRRLTRSVFTWGILIMGVYGVVQYFSPLPWDRFWVIASEMTTIGRPDPYELRIFSTLNSPGPFAGILMVGLLVLLEARSVSARLALAPGFVSFLLSLVRSAWGGFAVALLYAGVRLQSRLRLRLLVVLGVGALLSLPLLLNDAVSERVAPRVETLGQIGSDDSFRARSSLYSIAALNSITEPIGRGLGSFGRAATFNEKAIASFDSGLMIIPFTLGWTGATLYLFGWIWMIYWILRLRQRDTDQFTMIAAAIVTGMIAQMVFSNQLTGVIGMATWTFTALAVAGGRYYETRRTEESPAAPAPTERDAAYA